MSYLYEIVNSLNETLSRLGAVPSVVIGTMSTRASRGGKNTIRIKDRRKVKYRKFTKEDLVKASKKFVKPEEYYG